MRPGRNMAAGFVGVVGAAAQAEPEHVHRRAEVLDLKPRLVAHGGMAAVAADHQRAADREIAVRRVGAARR